MPCPIRRQSLDFWAPLHFIPRDGANRFTVRALIVCLAQAPAGARETRLKEAGPLNEKSEVRHRT